MQIQDPDPYYNTSADPQFLYFLGQVWVLQQAVQEWDRAAASQYILQPAQGGEGQGE